LISGQLRIAATCIVAAGGVAAAYVASVTGFEQLLKASSVAREVASPSAIDVTVGSLVVTGFLAVFAIQTAATGMGRFSFVRALHVHAANGFYLDIPARRLTARVWGLISPVP
jgi:NAD(P)H-quinone oxidoreductase subunit 5